VWVEAFLVFEVKRERLCLVRGQEASKMVFEGTVPKSASVKVG
jgi:hypothetical protein